MKKRAIIIPIMALSLVAFGSGAIASVLAGGTVYVVYQSGDGTFEDGTTLKSFSVRQGIRWGRRSNREKPLIGLEAEDDQMVFDGSWSLDGTVLDDNYLIDRDIIVTANYEVDTPDYVFATDSWNVLAKESEQGLDHLIQSYNPSGGTFIIQNLNDADEVKEKTRTVTFNARKYTVRVIGEEADPQEYSELGEFSNFAPLTFQFNEIIDKVTLATMESYSNCYVNSHLRETLNNETLSLLEKGVRNHIRPVYKVTNEGEGSGLTPSTGEVDVKQEYIFPLSLKEMNGEAYNAQFLVDDPNYNFPYEIENESYDENGFIYPYYKADTHSGALPSLAKRSLDSANAQPYWTRSPEIVSSYFTWEIGSEGRLGHYDSGIYQGQAPEDVVTPLGIAPCFCF